MFDNEIDWVTRLERCLPVLNCREVDENGAAKSKHVYIQGRAHAIGLVQVTDSGKCSSKKSVFRSATRQRVSVTSCSQADLYVG
jgi:hypothetical protein